jgi:hypothetical protein
VVETYQHRPFGGVTFAPLLLWVDLWLCPMAVLIGSYSILLRTLLVGETEDPQR